MRPEWTDWLSGPGIRGPDAGSDRAGHLRPRPARHLRRAHRAAAVAWPVCRVGSADPGGLAFRWAATAAVAGPAAGVRSGRPAAGRADQPPVAHSRGGAGDRPGELRRG